MSNSEDLSQRMKEDWDRRVKHDYRLWMSDGIKDDQAMWESGVRDFEIISKDIPHGPDKSVLEIGCGVGRLLFAATKYFGKIIGVDVSEEAIKKAKDFLNQIPSIQPVLGNGVDINFVPSSSIDFVFSFASITSMPTEVIARYLCETRRVLKDGSFARFQVYVGDEQNVSKDDTLHVRCFQEEKLRQACILAGFSVTSLEELILPFQVSFKELGLTACMLTLKADGMQSVDFRTIEKTLSTSEQATDIHISPVEFWMSYNHAKAMVSEGDFERAEKALLYASDIAKATSFDVADTLSALIKEIEKEKFDPKKNAPAQSAPTTADFYKENLSLLPVSLRDRIEKLSHSTLTSITITEEGPALYYKGQPLDHPTKPKTAAIAWAKRALTEPKIANAKDLVVFGFGSGFHIDEILKSTQKEITVFEPSLESFSEAIKIQSLPFLKNVKLYVEEDLPRETLSESELLVRPQTQSLFPEEVKKLKSLFYSRRGLSLLKPSIAVLSPVQGGSLPITTYTTRSLLSLSQKAREIDMSGFASGYHAVENIIFDKTRRTIAQGQYVQMLSHAALESINEKPIDILFCMAQAPVSIELLSECRKRGIITVLWFVEDYLRFTYWQSLAPYFDYIFTIQRGECIEAIKKAGAGNVHYMPLACDPVIHAPVELSIQEKEFFGSKVSFVGAGYHNRQQLFASLSDLPFKIWGTEWPTCRPFDKLVQAEGKRITPEDYVKIFNASEINLNLHSSTERDGVDPNGDFVNPRTFELASAGAFQLVDKRTHLPELFTDGEDIVTFTSREDLREKIDYYLRHPEEREKITKKAQARVYREHTYAHRMQEMLSIIYGDKFDHIKSRYDGSPWRRLLDRAKPHKELTERCEKAFTRGEEPVLDGLISDIVTGNGQLSDTEQKLLFLYHIRKQMIRMRAEESGG